MFHTLHIVSSFFSQIPTTVLVWILSLIIFFIVYLGLKLAYIYTKKTWYDLATFNLAFWGLLYLYPLVITVNILLIVVSYGGSLLSTFFGLGCINLVECQGQPVPTPGIQEVDYIKVHPQCDPCLNPPIFVDVDHNGETLTVLVVDKGRSIYYHPQIGFCGYNLSYFDAFFGKTGPCLRPYTPYYDCYFDGNGVFCRISGPDLPIPKGDPDKGSFQLIWESLFKSKKVASFDPVRAANPLDFLSAFSEGGDTISSNQTKKVVRLDSSGYPSYNTVPSYSSPQGDSVEAQYATIYAEVLASSKQQLLALSFEEAQVTIAFMGESVVDHPETDFEVMLYRELQQVIETRPDQN